jgi:hypothetical protein
MSTGELRRQSVEVTEKSLLDARRRRLGSLRVRPLRVWVPRRHSPLLCGLSRLGSFKQAENKFFVFRIPQVTQVPAIREHRHLIIPSAAWSASIDALSTRTSSALCTIWTFALPRS